jgi:NADPH:quinone reductase-like Zn-dependent oxidoreductase
MSRAVRFDEYGGIGVLKVVDVEPPVPGPGELLVRVKATSINPGEAKIRDGALADLWPTTFPSGEGSDVAGVVEQVGDGVDSFKTGDEVIGFTDNRAAHAELVVIEAGNATPKPPNVSWEAAGSLHVAGATAWAAVRAVDPKPGDTVVVSGGAGGVGSLTVQLAALAGAKVIGLASEHNHEWLSEHGVTPVTYGDGVADRIREASGGSVDAFIDTVGSGYVQLALDLGVAPDRIDTIADFEAGPKYGVKMDGNAVGASAEVLAELAALIDQGRLEVPIAAVYPLEQVREAFTELAKNHTRGKIVLEP